MTRFEARYEYRVQWQREGKPKSRGIFQTEKGARAKVDALLWSDQEKRKPDSYASDGSYDAGGSYLTALPDLLTAPTIERRVVGDWELLPAAKAQVT